MCQAVECKRREVEERVVSNEEQIPSSQESKENRVISIKRNEAGQIVVKLAGSKDPITDAKIVRCFPWSVPDSYISIHNSDGKEAAMIKSLDVLDKASREIVEEELRDKVFNPKIHRIVDFKDEFGVTSITAETDRGNVTFQIRSRDDVRILSAVRALFRDVDGTTYELPDLTALGNPGRRQIERYF